MALHNLLATIEVEKKTANKIISETTNLLKDFSDHFIGMSKTYKSLLEEELDKEDEYKKITTTVVKRLKYNAKMCTKFIDSKVSLEEANREAEAFLVLNNTSYGPFCVAALMDLETEFTKLLEMYKLIPTLKAGIDWNKDNKQENDIFISKPEITYSTKKTDEVVRVFEPTEHQPGTYYVKNCDVKVQKCTTIIYSGMISSNAKYKLLENINAILIAIKDAKSTANQTDFVKQNIAQSLFDYVHKDLD